MVHEVLNLKKVLHNFMIQHINTRVSNIIKALVKKNKTKERKRAPGSQTLYYVFTRGLHPKTCRDHPNSFDTFKSKFRLNE